MRRRGLYEGHIMFYHIPPVAVGAYSAHRIVCLTPCFTACTAACFSIISQSCPGHLQVTQQFHSVQVNWMDYCTTSGVMAVILSKHSGKRVYGYNATVYYNEIHKSFSWGQRGHYINLILAWGCLLINLIMEHEPTFIMIILLYNKHRLP